MKFQKFLIILIFVSTSIFSQRIGMLAPDKPLEKFPPNAWGVDIMFSDGGFGLGTSYTRNFDDIISGFIDFSISEIKDEREMEYIDYWGNRYIYGKKNRAMLFPLYAGIKYRVFTETLTENFRPFVTAGVGPTLIMVSPYLKDNEPLEFFSSLKYAKAKYTVGGYLGFGANFGINKKNSLGINIRYYVVKLIGEGIENIEGQERKDLSSIYISLSFGFLY